MLNFIPLQVDYTSIKIDNIIDTLLVKLVTLGQQIIAAVLFYIIARWVISLIRKVVNRILIRKKVDAAVVSFINSVVNMALQIMMVMIIISILGIETTSFAAVLAAAGLAIGMAMKDNLSNFAGGIMLLMNKPFKLGDRIVAQSMDGTVCEIGILYTVLLTGDNRTIYLPNGPLSTGGIVNYSNQPNRRVDITLNINYGNDADEIKSLLTDIVSADENVLRYPASFVGLTMLNNGSYDIEVRAWVARENFGMVKNNLNENIYRALTNKGVYTSSTLVVQMKERE